MSDFIPGGDRASGSAGLLDRDERWLLVERIAASSAFRKAGRLRELLRHVAELSIRGRTAEITEQRIGEAVFGKPPGYSPVEDSSVRVHMRQLRLRLHEYFDSEGRDEPLIVEIPKGGYALAFHSIPIPAPVPLIELPAASLARRRWPHLRVVLPWTLAAGFSALSLALWLGARAPSHARIGWPLSAVLGNGYGTQMVLADATYGIRRLISHRPASLEEYVKRDFQRGTEHASAKADAAWLSRYSADALLTSWADVAIATSFLRLVPGTMDQVLVRSARDIRLRDLESGNFIFVGSPASNPWVLLFENRLNFEEVRSDELNGVEKYFRNGKPLPGERDRYQGLPRTGLDGEDYAAIALIPTESRRGSILIIQGLQQESTEAAGLFLADEGGRQRLKKALAIQSDPASPVYFEALLRIQAVAGSPSSTTVVAGRVFQQ